MTKKLHKEIPIDYAVCQQQDCPRAEKCLHQIAYRPLIEQPATVLRLLNPTLCTRMGLAPTSETPLPSPTHGVSPECRAGCSRRNTSNSCRYSCPISDVTPTSSGEGANFHSHLKSKGSC